jgi:hypothetical protein
MSLCYAWRKAGVLAMRDTDYATEIATTGGEERIERLLVKESGVEFAPRPLDMPEDELLVLFGRAISKGVFSADFLKGLQTTLNGHLGDE